MESVSEVYEPKRAESTTDVRRPTKPWAKKPGMKILLVSLHWNGGDGAVMVL